jgi:hypothetical protein
VADAEAQRFAGTTRFDGGQRPDGGQRLDPPAPLYTPGRRRAVTERSPVVVAAAFALAVVIGIVIGLVTAPHAKGAASATTKPTTSSPPEASPTLPSPPAWAANRVPGTAHQMSVRAEDRTAFQASLAAFLRDASGSTAPTTADVTIPSGALYYGAVEGTDLASDVYWAVGTVTVVGATTQSPQVWKRAASAPWLPVARGSGACAIRPSQLYHAWGGTPKLCG